MGLNLFINSLQSDPTFFFAVLITVVVSITLHELAHGIAAVRLGDDTPIVTGHMTLNPVVHMGLQSLILLVIAGIAFGAMPVDRTRLRGKYGEAIVAAAGPACNGGLALLSLLGLAIWHRFDHTAFVYWSPASTNARYLLFIFGETNVLLMLFNLLPVPPLDGSWIAANVFPAYRRFLSSDIVRGAGGALLFALIIGAGTFVQRGANRTSVRLLTAVSGRPAQLFSVIIQHRVPITQADDIRALLERLPPGNQIDDHIFDD